MVDAASGMQNGVWGMILEEMVPFLDPRSTGFASAGSLVCLQGH